MLNSKGFIPQKIGNKYNVIKPIGKGAFGVVLLVEEIESKQVFACKMIPRTNQKMEAKIHNEIRIMQSVQHRNIIKLLDLFVDEYNYYLVTEYCPKGTLHQYIATHRHIMEHTAKQMIVQILEAVDYLHRSNISHRDLKPENILIDAHGTLKITDFGLSAFFQDAENDLVQGSCGSALYASPECLSGKPYSGRSTDAWSLGIVFFVLLTGKLPWRGNNTKQVFKEIRKGKIDIPLFLTKHCQEFLSGLLTVEPEKRLTIKDARHHPWIKAIPRISANSSTFVVRGGRLSLKKVNEFITNSSNVSMSKENQLNNSTNKDNNEKAEDSVLVPKDNQDNESASPAKKDIRLESIFMKIDRMRCKK